MAWQRAVRLLAAHDRSEQEIRDALAGAGVAAQRINATISRLRQLHFLDDRRLAAQVADRAARRGFGSERVRTELHARGVDAALVDAAVGAAFEDEMTLAQQAYARRFADAPLPLAQRAKAARFLLGRGFPEQVVLAILGEGC